MPQLQVQEKRRVSFKVFSLDEEANIIEQLEQIAREEDRSLSQVFRLAFRSFLASRQSQTAESSESTTTTT